MAQTYYLFRHGETFATKYSRGFYGIGIYRASILPEFTKSLIEMGKYLKNVPSDYNVSSQLRRCKETVAIISEQAGKQFAYDKRLNEFFLESIPHLRNRVTSFLENMEKENYHTIIVCTHGAVIAAMTRLLRGEQFSLQNLREFPSPGVLLKIQQGSIEQLDFNEKNK